VLAEVCGEEAAEAKRLLDPDKFCFGVYVTARGSFAAQIAARISMADFPKTKKLLCSYIVDGWLGCRERKEEELFVNVLCTWAGNEAKEAGDVIRSVIESRFEGHERKPEEIARLARFFSRASLPAYEPRAEIWGAVFKAIGRYANVNDIVILGKALNLLRGNLRQTFCDFVENGVKN
jgi:hypothetical protein